MEMDSLLFALIVSFLIAFLVLMLHYAVSHFMDLSSKPRRQSHCLEVCAPIRSRNSFRFSFERELHVKKSETKTSTSAATSKIIFSSFNNRQRFFNKGITKLQNVADSGGAAQAKNLYSSNCHFRVTKQNSSWRVLLGLNDVT